MRAAVEQLHLAATAQPKASDELLSYDQLAFTFRIDGGGLRLHGGCTGAATGEVLAGQFVLLAEPVAQPQPLAALIQALVPAGQFQVPATPQSGWLARWLPLPEAAAAADSPPALHHRPISASAGRSGDVAKIALYAAGYFCDSPPRLRRCPGSLRPRVVLSLAFLIKRFRP